MAEFKESETRRVVEGGALSEQTALEWIGERAEDELFRRLVAVKGLGAWSVHMYMLFQLHKPLCFQHRYNRA